MAVTTMASVPVSVPLLNSLKQFEVEFPMTSTVVTSSVSHVMTLFQVNDNATSYVTRPMHMAATTIPTTTTGMSITCNIALVWCKLYSS